MSQEQCVESKKPEQEFERLNDTRRPSLVHEFLAFIAENKKWWLTPILIVFALVGILVTLGSTGAAPFIYTLF